MVGTEVQSKMAKRLQTYKQNFRRIESNYCRLKLSNFVLPNFFFSVSFIVSDA